MFGFIRVLADFPDQRGMHCRNPLCLFGLEELAALLSADRDAEEETEVLDFLARECGLPTVRADAARARELGITFCVPYEGAPNRSGALAAVKKLTAVNKVMPRLNRLLALLEEPGPETLPFLAGK